jgi:molybdenum cofactor guanylyltransferase
MEAYAAVILAGGAARRLGGQDKPARAVGGVPMLHRVLAAVAGARQRIVVGPPRAGLPPDVRCVREEPLGGGPVAATAAGLALVDTQVVVLVAADLPHLTAAAVDQLRSTVDAEPGGDGVVFVDGGGRRQYLCGAWRTAALRAAIERAPGPAMRAVVAELRVADVRTEAEPAPWYDCDTEDDLRRADERAG